MGGLGPLDGRKRRLHDSLAVEVHPPGQGSCLEILDFLLSQLRT